MATTNKNTVTQTFPVLGMTCASCASSAESIVTHQNYRDWETDRKSTRLNSSHITRSRMPSSA